MKDEKFEPQPASNIQGEEPSLPISQQNLLASIRDTRLDTRVENDDDNMTEETSRTDDDVLRDAFQFLHASAENDEEEQDDEIVWDPRHGISLS